MIKQVCSNSWNLFFPSDPSADLEIHHIELSGVLPQDLFNCAESLRHRVSRPSRAAHPTDKILVGPCGCTSLSLGKGNPLVEIANKSIKTFFSDTCQGTCRVDTHRVLKVKGQMNTQMVLGAVLVQAVASFESLSSQSCKSNLTLTDRMPWK